MKKSVFPILFLLFCCSAVFGQNLTVGVSGTPLRTLDRHNDEGSPYFNDQFVKSDLVSLNGKTIPQITIRYNVLNQQVEYLNENSVYEIQDSLLSFKVTDTTGRVHLLERKNMNTKPYFFESLAAGKIALLKRYSARTNTSEDWYTKKKTKTIVHEVSYFVMKGDVIDKFSPSKKSLLTLFADQAEQIKTFMNNNAIDFKSDESLRALFEYYNTQSK